MGSILHLIMDVKGKSGSASRLPCSDKFSLKVDPKATALLTGS